MRAALRKIKQSRDAPKEGKQSVKELPKGGSLQSIEITDGNIKAFEPYARKSSKRSPRQDQTQAQGGAGAITAAKLTAFLKIRILPNLPYLMVFWFAEKLGTAYRLASGKDLLQRLTHSMAMLNTAMSSIWPSFELFDLTAGVAGSAITYAVVYAKRKNAKKYRKDMEYGSARWGKPEDIQPFMDAKHDNRDC